MIKIIF
jgi:hypothetical protein